MRQVAYVCAFNSCYSFIPCFVLGFCLVLKEKIYIFISRQCVFSMAFTLFLVSFCCVVCNMLWVEQWYLLCKDHPFNCFLRLPHPNTTIIYPQFELFFFSNFFLVCFFCVLSLENNYGHYNFYLPPSV